MCFPDHLHRLLSTFAGALLAVTLSAQSVEQWTTWGDASMERGAYYGASRFYAGALSAAPGRMVLQWKQAEAYRLSNQYDLAAALYDKIHRKDMGRTYPDALRWLGEMQLCTAAYTDAERTWNKVLQREKDKGSAVAQRAANALTGIELASRSPSDSVIMEHLPAPLNTYDSEFGARSGPGSTLYFTALRGELNDDQEVMDTAAYHTRILRSAEHGGRWSEPEILRSSEDAVDIANPAWSTDGRWFLFTRCDPGQPCRIHIAAWDSTGYKEAKPLPGLNMKAMSTQPMVARWDAREMLLFVSDASGGMGGTDIWQAELIDGTAHSPMPVYGPVNTPGNERCPWYDATSSTLWFSSDHLPGLGGYDIFTSTFANDVFAAPVNAGAPLNSPANDLYPALYNDRGEGWLTSNRVGSFAAKGETCCNDLYRWKISPTAKDPLAGRTDSTVASSSIRKVQELSALQHKLPLRLYFHNDQPDPRSWARSTALDYGTTYLSYKELVPVYLREQAHQPTTDAFFKDHVDAGYAALGGLVEALINALEAGHDVTLDVRGHASPLAKNDYNVNLSERRISSLFNYLLLANDGKLVPYLRGSEKVGNRLELRQLPFGEERTATGVSDRPDDVKRSVYSVEAALERRIEVVGIEWSDRREVTKDLIQMTKEMGPLRMEAERIITFNLVNDRDVPFKLVESTADCGCTTVELPTKTIAPGEMVPVSIRFSGHAPAGPLKRSISITTDNGPLRFELTLKGTMVP